MVGSQESNSQALWFNSIRKELAGRCHCRGIIRLLSFTICQANWVRKCCVLSLHFSVTAWRRSECRGLLTQWRIRVLWNIHRVQCGHTAEGIKAITLSLLRRLRAPHFMSPGAVPMCRIPLFCRLPFFFTECLYDNLFCIHQTYSFIGRGSVFRDNMLPLPVPTIIMMQVSVRGRVSVG